MDAAMFEIYAVATSIILVLIFIWVLSIHKVVDEKLAKLIEKQDRTNQLLERLGQKDKDAES